MKRNFKQIIMKASYQMGNKMNLSKKLLAINKAGKEVKDILNPKEK